MLDQLLETFRKASESSAQMQHDMFKAWSQQWMPGPSNATALTGDVGRNYQKRWLDLTVELLHKHREAVDSSYKSSIQLIEQSIRVSEARSSEEYRKMAEELWRKAFEVFKDQSESQFRDFQTWAEKSFELARDVEARVQPNGDMKS